MKLPIVKKISSIELVRINSGYYFNFPFKKKIPGGGFVRMIDCMPRIITCKTLRADEAIVQAARVSYGETSKGVEADTKLIKYLMKHGHSTPIECIQFKFHIKCPIFVQRHIVKHRMTTMNEISGRYTQIKDEFYIPEKMRYQSKKNKQGGQQLVECRTSEELKNTSMKNIKKNYQIYQEMINKGISKETARMFLPQNIFTEFYLKIDLHNLFHFLRLRNDSHTQYETRQYAAVMEEMIKITNPISSNHFRQ